MFFYNQTNKKINNNQARRQNSVAGGGGAEINFGREGTRSLFMWIRERHGGTRNSFQCGSNEQGEDQKKGLLFKNFHK